MVEEPPYREIVAAALGGRAPASGFSVVHRQAFLDWVSNERVAGLLFSTAERSAWMPALGDDLLQAARLQLALATLQEHELRRLIGRFCRAGISPILLKGAALAYTVYPDASLRPRGDTDVLIQADEAACVRTLLEDLGYEPELQVPGNLVASQFSYRRRDSHRIHHVVDVHLKISNPQAYANRLSYAEVLADAVPLHRIDAHALAPSRIHSLLIACIHRVAHHEDADTLLWLYDIRLLAGVLGGEEWERLVDLAAAKELSAVVLRGLDRAHDAFGPCVPLPVLSQLRARACRETPAPLLGGTGMFSLLRTDFAALPDWRARRALVREHLLPPRWYIRRAYPNWPVIFLPLAYVYRAFRGALRRLGA